MGKDLSDDVIEQIAKKGNVKTVQAELMKDPKVVAFAKQMTKNGELPFYRKGILSSTQAYMHKVSLKRQC